MLALNSVPFRRSHIRLSLENDVELSDYDLGALLESEDVRQHEIREFTASSRSDYSNERPKSGQDITDVSLRLRNGRINGCEIPVSGDPHVYGEVIRIISGELRACEEPHSWLYKNHNWLAAQIVLAFISAILVWIAIYRTYSDYYIIAISLAFCTFILLPGLLTDIRNKLFPAFSFEIGRGEKISARRRGLRIWIITGILAAIPISILANWLS